MIKVNPFDVIIECSVINETSELYEHKRCDCTIKHGKVWVKIFADQYHRVIQRAASLTVANVWVDMAHDNPHAFCKSCTGNSYSR